MWKAASNHIVWLVQSGSCWFDSLVSEYLNRDFVDFLLDLVEYQCQTEGDEQVQAFNEQLVLTAL